MIQFYIGKVEEVQDNHVITFSVDTIADEIAPYPRAVAAMKLTRYPQVGDEVLILRPDSNFEIFLYWLTSDEEFDISLNYDNARIRIYKDDSDKYYIVADDSQGSTFTMTENTVMVKVQDTTLEVTNQSINGVIGNSSIEMLSDGVTINANGSTISMSSSEVTINNHLKVT